MRRCPVHWIVIYQNSWWKGSTNINSTSYNKNHVPGLMSWISRVRYLLCNQRWWSLSLVDGQSCSWECRSKELIDCMETEDVSNCSSFMIQNILIPCFSSVVLKIVFIYVLYSFWSFYLFYSSKKIIECCCKRKTKLKNWPMLMRMQSCQTFIPSPYK